MLTYEGGGLSLSALMRHKVSIHKKNGEEFGDIQALVHAKIIFCQRSNILIETGDLIKKKMSNGATEVYKVIDPGFHESIGAIPAAYQITYKNLGLQEVEKATKSNFQNFSHAKCES